MTKEEVDNAVLMVYNGYNDLDEDLKQNVILWTLEKGGTYASGTSTDVLVRDALKSIKDRENSSQDYVDVMNTNRKGIRN